MDSVPIVALAIAGRVNSLSAIFVYTKLKDNSKSLDNLDTISGCTYTSRYLKDIVSKTINDYNS